MPRHSYFGLTDAIEEYVKAHSAEIPVDQLEAYCCARDRLGAEQIVARLGRDLHSACESWGALKKSASPPIPEQVKKTWRLHRPGHRHLSGGGYVYFIQGVDGGRVKIGWAKRPASRLRELQTGSPVALRIVAVMPGSREDERTHHRRFERHRCYGEWFFPAPELLEYMNETIDAWPDCNT